MVALGFAYGTVGNHGGIPVSGWLQYYAPDRCPASVGARAPVFSATLSWPAGARQLHQRYGLASSASQEDHNAFVSNQSIGAVRGAIDVIDLAAGEVAAVLRYAMQPGIGF